MIKQIVLNGRTISYDLERKNVKNLNLRIKPDQSVFVSANHLVDEKEAQEETTYEQYNLFTDYDRLEKQKKEENAALEKERKLQQAMLDIKSRFGKNAVLKGTNFLEGATARERNEEIGGHKA